MSEIDNDDEMNFVVVDRKGHSESAAEDFKVRHAGGALPLEQQLPEEGTNLDAAPKPPPPPTGTRPELVTPTMAELYMKQGHYGEAAQMWQRLLSQKPGDPDMLAKLEECRAKLAPPPVPGATPAVAAAPQAAPKPPATPPAPAAPAAPAPDPKKAQTLATLERWLANARRMSAA